MPRDARNTIDADFEVVSGPLRIGEEHPKRRGWRFTGRYDKQGHPLFYSRVRDLRVWMGGITAIGWTLVVLVAAATIGLCIWAALAQTFH